MTRSSRHAIGRRTVLALVLGALTVALVAPVAEAASPKTKRVSVNNNGAEPTEESGNSEITPDGRFVVFWSLSDDLAGKDTNGQGDIYVRNVQKKKTRRVSVHSNGTQGDAESTSPSISANGRYVAFGTLASTLFKGDKNGTRDIVIRDRKTGKTKLISKSSGGTKGDADSINPDITPDGRYVVFASEATNLVSGDTKGNTHVYIHDRMTKKTKLVSKSSSGKRGDSSSWAPSVSANGRFIAFYSSSKNLVKNDNNGASDIFVHDRKRKRTTLVSVRSGGSDGGFGDHSRRPQISADGKIVTFESEADLAGSDGNGGEWDIYVHNRATKKTKQISVSSSSAAGNALSRSASISPDGRFVAFTSEADNLVSGDDNAKDDIFVRDRKKGKTKRISVGIDGTEPDDDSGSPSVSAGGRFVAFKSSASNLVASNENGWRDVFRRGPLR